MLLFGKICERTKWMIPDAVCDLPFYVVFNTSISIELRFFNPLVPNASFLYPLKTSEKRMGTNGLN